MKATALMFLVGVCFCAIGQAQQELRSHRHDLPDAPGGVQPLTAPSEAYKDHLSPYGKGAVQQSPQQSPQQSAKQTYTAPAMYGGEERVRGGRVRGWLFRGRIFGGRFGGC